MPKGTLYNTKNKDVVAVCTRHHDGNVPEFVFAQVMRKHRAHGGIYLDLKLVTPKFKYKLSDFNDVNARYVIPMAPSYLGDLVRDGRVQDCFIGSATTPVDTATETMTLDVFCRHLHDRGVSEYFTNKIVAMVFPGSTKQAVAARVQAKRAFRLEFEDTFTEEFLTEIEAFVSSWLKLLQKRARS
jgi:hypothetical protein